MTLSGRESLFLAIVKRDILLLSRRRMEAANGIVFFLLVATLFAVAAGPGRDELRRLAPAALWVAALLSSTLTLDMLFRDDYEDGCLEQFLVSGRALSGIVAAKMLAHCLCTGVPLLLSALPVALLLSLEPASLPPLLLALALGVPIFSLLGGALAALTVGLRNGAVLLSLLLLPLYVPLLIFATGATRNAARGLSIEAEIYFLAGLLLLALTLSPLTAAAALRLRMGS